MNKKNIIRKLTLLLGVMVLPILYSQSVNATISQNNTQLTYRSYVQTKGYLPWVADGQVSGITGQSLRLEAWMLSLGSNLTSGEYAGSTVSYRSYMGGSGWQNWRGMGVQSGDANKKIEMINIKLSGAVAEKYDIYYSVYTKAFGWHGWAKNGENAGSNGYGYYIEGIKAVLVAKGGAAPGSTEGAFKMALLDSVPGTTFYLQIQNGGGFLYEDAGVLNLGRYNAIANKDYYKWKKIEYPASSGKYLLQNIGSKKVLGEDLKLQVFDALDGQFWSITENPSENIYGTYSIRNINKNLYLDGVLTTNNVPTLSLAAASSSNNQKINMINVQDGYLFDIKGVSTVSKASAREYVISKVGAAYFNSTAPIYPGSTITINQYYNRVIDAYYNIAPIYGVKPEVALAQALHETGNMKFGGLVSIGDFNFAGIYATGQTYTADQLQDLKGADPNKVELVPGNHPARWKTIEYGVEGHIHHLLAYATSTVLTDTNNDDINEINGVTLASPRFNLIPAYKRNTGQILPGLNAQWAVPGYTYGQSIMNIVKAMGATNPVIQKVALTEGIYAIDSDYSDLRIEVDGASLENNVALKQQYSSNKNNQYWNIEKVSEGIYRIISIRSGKALSIRNNKIVQDYWQGDQSQLWYFSDNGNGSHKIWNSSNDVVLTLASESKSTGVEVTTSTNDSVATSAFNLVIADYNLSDTIMPTKAIKGVMDGVYNIKNVTNNFLLNVPTEGTFRYVSPNPRNYVQLTQWAANSTIAQKFNLVRMSTGEYKIIGVNSGKLLTVVDTVDNSKVIQLYDNVIDNKQLWKLTSSGSGYTVKNVGSAKYLASSSSLQGSGMIQSSSGQVFSLTKIADIPNSGEKTNGLAGKVVWIDPGHGSSYTGYYDSGALGPGFNEDDSNTWHALELARKLEEGGAIVKLTRTAVNTSMTIDNRQRSYMANEANADIFISIHSNSSVDKTAYGAETYYYLPSSVDDPSYQSTKDFDKRIVNSKLLANYVQPKMASGGGYFNRGVKGDDFAVIGETAMPAILVEIGFISNTSDAAKINSATNRINTVNGIYQGISDYFNNVY